jgi:glycosyltransferase involved in cell wall biosynthesis
VKVAVNLLWCRPGQVGGSEEYVCRALAALADEPRSATIRLYALPSFAAAHPELAGAAKMIDAPTTGSNRALRVAIERTWLRRRVHADGVDVVHHAGGTVPFGGRGRQPPTVVSVHDVQYVTHPENFSTTKRRWLAMQAPAAVRRAEVVTVPSAWVGATLRDHLGAEPARIHVVPHAAPPAIDVTAEEKADVRLRYDLAGRYLVYPAATYPHKNHLLLLDVIGELSARHPDLRLVLTGGPGRAEADVTAGIAARRVSDLVRRTGRVPDRDRDALLAGAALLVFPSRYEGFGAPVVEAMAAGVPVVASNATALPEVVGNAGRLLDPDEPKHWAAAIDELLDDAAARQDLVAAGRRRAASSFEPARAAAALRDAYTAAVAAAGEGS